MEPSHHVDPEVSKRANQLLRDAGYPVAQGNAPPEPIRLKLRALRIKAFLVYPIVIFALLELMWFFKMRTPIFSLLLFAAVVWTVFFGFYRAYYALYHFRCPACGERFFFTKTGWLFRWGNIWSNRCKNCGHHAS